MTTSQDHGHTRAPHLVLGTMTFGDTTDLATAREMVDRSLEAGVSAVDTANGYADGRSETLLGEILTGRRDQVQIATKAGIYTGDAGGAPVLSPAALRSSLEASLRRLGTEDVDLFYLHQPDRSVPLEETLAAVGELIDRGLTRAFGISNYSAWQIADIHAICDRLGMPRPQVAQQLYSLVARSIEGEYVEFARDKQVTTIVYSPLGAGMLSGRYDFGSVPTQGRFGDSAVASMYRDRYWHQATFEAVRTVAAIAEDAGMPLPELAYRWLCSKPVVSGILLGGSRVTHIEAAITAVRRGPLPADVVAACDDATASLAGSTPRYNR